MKKLYRSNSDRKICGVCGGIGEYFGIDSTIVRLIFLVFGLVSVGVVFYLLAALIMPMELQATVIYSDQCVFWNENFCGVNIYFGTGYTLDMNDMEGV